MTAAAFWIDSTLAILLHELAHVAVAWTHGVKIKRLGISWRGPFIVREHAAVPMTDAKIALAGPVANLILALSFWQSAHVFALVNLILGVYNLIPFIPRNDGSHALRAIRSGREMRQCLQATQLSGSSKV